MLKFNKALVFLFTLTLFLLVSPSVNAYSFKDVSYTYWAYDDIEFLSNHRVINGFSDGRFMAGESIKRKDAAVMLNRVLEINEKISKPINLKDVNSTTSGYKDILIAVDKGWLTVKDGKFEPDQKLTREEMAKALAVAFLYEGDGSSYFTDVDFGNPYYSYIDAIAYQNITTGYKDNTFRPKELVTRAQFSAFLSRVIHQPIAYEVKSEGEVVATVRSVNEALEIVSSFSDGTIHPASNRFINFSHSIANKDNTGLESGVLIYNGVNEKDYFFPDYFRHYLSYIDGSGIKKEMFDTFIILGLRYDGGWLAETDQNKANYKDWSSYIDRTFSSTGALKNLNLAAAQENRTVDVYIAIPYPKRTEAIIGLDGAEIPNNLYSRYDMVKWYTDSVNRKWKDEYFSNLNFKGFYWLNETVKVAEDEILLSSIAQQIHMNKQLFIYAPHATSTNFPKWKSYGFDGAFLQPNAFRSTVPDKEERLHRAFLNAQIYGTGITMEINSYAPHQAEQGVETFTMYMDFAKRYGLDEKGMIFYQDINMIERMATYDHPIYRTWYNQLISTFFD